MPAGDIRSVLLVLVIAVPAVACGGGASDDVSTRRPAPTSEPVSSAQWRSELDTACEGLNSDFDDLPDASPRNRRDAVAYAVRVEQFASGMVEVLDDAAPVPPEQRREAEHFGEQVEDLALATRELRIASEDGDADAAANATDEVVEIGAGLNSAADALGVEACGGF